MDEVEQGGYCAREGAGCLGMARMNLMTKWSDTNQNRQTDRKARGQLVGVYIDRQTEWQTVRHNRQETGSYLGQ